MKNEDSESRSLPETRNPRLLLAFSVVPRLERSKLLERENDGLEILERRKFRCYCFLSNPKWAFRRQEGGGKILKMASRSILFCIFAHLSSSTRSRKGWRQSMSHNRMRKVPKAFEANFREWKWWCKHKWYCFSAGCDADTLTRLSSFLRKKEV